MVCRQHRAGISLGDVLLPGEAAGGALPAEQPPKRKGEVDIMIKVPMLGYAVLSSAFSIGICRKSRVFSFVVT